VSTVVVVVAGCTFVTVAIKGIGPVLSGGRELPAALQEVLSLVAPPLLAALVVVSALSDGRNLAVGAQTAGVAVSGLVYWRTRSVVGCVVVAAVVTALLRDL
jgi:branched-subunit amino acid transport protein